MTIYRSAPRTLVMTYHCPICTFVSDEVIGDQYGSVEDIYVDGQTWYTRDTPLIVEADILYERRTRFFIGLTFAIHHPEWELHALAQMLKGLDPNVIRVTDYSNPVIRAAYPETCRSTLYLEVQWYPCVDYSYECAQLLYGGWAFGYSVPNPPLFRHHLPWSQPYGLVVADVMEHLNAFDLRFPDRLPYPPDLVVEKVSAGGNGDAPSF